MTAEHELQPVAVIASDTHLIERMWTSRNLTDDAYYSFQQVIQYAQKFHVPLILAGDITHRRIIDSRTLQELSRINSIPDKCYIIQGQHDLQPIPYLKVINPDKVIWLEEYDHTLDLGQGWKIFGFDWKSPMRLPEHIKSIPTDTSLLVLHQVFEKFMGNITNPELSVALIPEFISLLVIGDYHAYFYGSLTEDHELPKVLSPGGTVLTSLGDKLKKGCFLLMGTPHNFEMRFLPIKTRPVFTTTIENKEALDDFIKRREEVLEKLISAPKKMELPPELQLPIVYIKYPLPLRKDIQETIQLLEKVSFTIVREFPDTEALQNSHEMLDGDVADLFSAERKIDFSVFLKHFISEKDDPDLMFVCKELLNENNTLESVRKAYFARAEAADASHSGCTHV